MPTSDSFFGRLFGRQDGTRRRRGVDRLDATAQAGWRSTGDSMFLQSISSLLSPAQNFVLLDTMRESIPLLDAGIMTLRQITGLPRIVTGDEGLDRLIKEEFLDDVPAGESGIGYDTYLDQNRDNALHYGFSVSELVPGPGLQGVEKLKVTDPRTFMWKKEEDRRFVLFQKPGAPGREEIRVDDFTWIRYWVYELRRGHPLGYSVLYKLEYPVQIALQILHAAAMNWERMGNPSFWLTLKVDTTNLQPDAEKPENTPESRVKKRLDALLADLAKTLGARREGRIRDFGAAITKDETLDIKVLGEPDKLIKPQEYWDPLMDQMLGKLGVPSWLLGQHRSTTERLSSNELQMMNSRVASRRRDEEPLIRRDVALAFALLGRPGTRFTIEWDGINLDDVVESARARLMNAQSEAIEKSNQGMVKPKPPAGAPVEDGQIEPGKKPEPDSMETPPQKGATNGNRLAGQLG